jgi:hypothetical protein
VEATAGEAVRRCDSWIVEATPDGKYPREKVTGNTPLIRVVLAADDFDRVVRERDEARAKVERARALERKWRYYANSYAPGLGTARSVTTGDHAAELDRALEGKP